MGDTSRHTQISCKEAALQNHTGKSWHYTYRMYSDRFLKDIIWNTSQITSISFMDIVWHCSWRISHQVRYMEPTIFCLDINGQGHGAELAAKMFMLEAFCCCCCLVWLKISLCFYLSIYYLSIIYWYHILVEMFLIHLSLLILTLTFDGVFVELLYWS